MSKTRGSHLDLIRALSVRLRSEKAVSGKFWPSAIVAETDKLLAESDRALARAAAGGSEGQGA